MTTDLYYQLIAYAKKLLVGTKGLGSVHLLDMVHDIICEGGITEQGFTKLFYEKRRQAIEEKEQYPISIDRLMEHGQPRYWSKYNYCYCCDDVLPLDYFYLKGDKLCKKCHNKVKYQKDKPKITRADDYAEKQAAAVQKSRDFITDRYVRDVLKKNGVASENITPKMIDEKRKSIYLKRISGKTAKSKKEAV